MSSDQLLAIEVRSVGKVYRLYKRPVDRLKQALFRGGRRYFDEFAALVDIDFSIGSGEVLGVVGVNGAGKSTLLQLIAGTIEPSAGEVITRGRIAALLELGSGFNPEFTGRENIYLNASTLGLSKSDIDERLQSIIEFADIGLHIDQPVKTYSSGMYVRLAFSIASSVDPDILIVDEALSVGDGAFARRSFDRIMQIKQRGATVLFCSHALFHVEAFCDTAVWLDQGRMRAYGDVSEVLAQYQQFLDQLADPAGTGRESLSDDSDGLPMASEPAVGVEFSSNGAASIRAVRVELDGRSGRELYGESGKACLRVEIDFVSDPSLPAPTAGLVVSSEAGKILATHVSVQGGTQLVRDAMGQGTATVVLAPIPFNHGRFRVGVYLLCERAFHVYQWIDPAAYLNLHRDAALPGAFLVDAHWQSTAGSRRVDAGDSPGRIKTPEA